MSFQLTDHIGVSIKKAARLFERVANNDLDKLGVTYAQTIILIRLWDKDGQNQMELSKCAGLKQPTVVRLLDRMERDDLIIRIRNIVDKRVFNFFLTDKGKKICRKLENHANAMQKATTLNFTKNEVETLNFLISKILCNLQAAIDA